MRFKQMLLTSMVAAALMACKGESMRYSPDVPPAQKENTSVQQTPKEEPASASQDSQESWVVNPNPMPPMSASSVVTTEQTSRGRQMVVSADLNFETNSVRQTVNAIENLAIKHAGFVVFSEIETYINGTNNYPKADGNILQVTRYTHESNMTVRVPRERSSDFIKDLQEHIVFLDKQVFKSEDISLTLRKQELEAKRLHAMSEELRLVSKPAEDITQQQQIENNIRAEYDNQARENEAKLQQDYWRDKIDFATITLRFRQPEAIMQQLIPNPDAVAKQHTPHFGTVFMSMLKQGWDGIVAVFLFFLGFWPITLGIPAVYLGMKWVRRMRARRLSRKLSEVVQKSRRDYYVVDDIDDFD